MKRSEIFDILIAKVCEVCEVNEKCLIEGSRLQTVVDARILAVQYLHRIGFSHDDIALIVLRKLAHDVNLCPPLSEVKKKAKSIDKMYEAYPDKLKQSFVFGILSKDIRDYCREFYKEMYVEGMKKISY